MRQLDETEKDDGLASFLAKYVVHSQRQLYFSYDKGKPGTGAPRDWPPAMRTAANTMPLRNVLGFPIHNSGSSEITSADPSHQVGHPTFALHALF